MTNATLADAVNVAPCRSLTSLESRIRGLSDRLVEAQRPLRILDAVKWGDEVERAFFAAGARELPPVTARLLRRPSSPLRPRIQAPRAARPGARRSPDARPRSRGRPDAVRMCAEYRDVAALIAQRGTPAFGDLSRRLYGGTADRFHAGAPTLADLGQAMAAMLDNLAGRSAGEPGGADAGRPADGGDAVGAVVGLLPGRGGGAGAAVGRHRGRRGGGVRLHQGPG